jgi:AhpD family alkylhydroperoxidase
MCSAVLVHERVPVASLRLVLGLLRTQEQEVPVRLRTPARFLPPKNAGTRRHFTAPCGGQMATFGLIDYAAASPEVRAIYDDIMATRHTDWINNFWKALAHDPAHLQRTWDSLKAIMAPGALDPLTKELIYVAVSVTNGCAYCIASHTAAAQQAGMSAAMFAELMAVVGMANETNRLANGYQVAIDDRFRTPAPEVGNHGEPPVAAGAPGASPHQRQQPHARPARATAGGREATQTRAPASAKRAAASGAAPTAAGQPTRRRKR